MQGERCHMKTGLKVWTAFARENACYQIAGSLSLHLIGWESGART